MSKSPDPLIVAPPSCALLTLSVRLPARIWLVPLLPRSAVPNPAIVEPASQVKLVGGPLLANCTVPPLTLIVPEFWKGPLIKVVVNGPGALMTPALFTRLLVLGPMLVNG